MKRPTTWLIVAIMILACVAVRAQTPPTGTGISSANSTCDGNCGTLTFSAADFQPAITVLSNGEIICHQCAGVPKDSIIGTLIQSERDRLFKPITIGQPTPRITFTDAYAVGLPGTMRKYAHAQQPPKTGAPVAVAKVEPERQPVTLSADGTATLLELNRQIGELQTQIENIKLRQQILLLQEGAPKDYPVWQYDPVSKRVVVYPPKTEAAKKE